MGARTPLDDPFQDDIDDDLLAAASWLLAPSPAEAMGLPISSPAPAGLLPPAAALVAPQPRHGGSSVQATAAASQAAGLCQAGAAAWGAAPRFPQEQQQQQQRHRQGLPTVSRPVPSGLPASAWGVTAPQRAGSPVDSWLAGWQRLAEAQGCAASLLDSSTAQDLLRRAAGTLRQAGATPPLAADETHTLPPRSPAPSAAASTEDSSSPLNSSGADSVILTRQGSDELPSMLSVLSSSQPYMPAQQQQQPPPAGRPPGVWGHGGPPSAPAACRMPKRKSEEMLRQPARPLERRASAAAAYSRPSASLACTQQAFASAFYAGATAAASAPAPARPPQHVSHAATQTVRQPQLSGPMSAMDWDALIPDDLLCDGAGSSEDSQAAALLAATTQPYRPLAGARRPPLY